MRGTAILSPLSESRDRGKRAVIRRMIKQNASLDQTARFFRCSEDTIRRITQNDRFPYLDNEVEDPIYLEEWDAEVMEVDDMEDSVPGSTSNPGVPAANRTARRQRQPQVGATLRATGHSGDAIVIYSEDSEFQPGDDSERDGSSDSESRNSEPPPSRRASARLRRQPAPCTSYFTLDVLRVG